jgi:hypothetical protein
MSYLKDWASLRGTLIRLARSRDTVFTADTSHPAALVRPPQGFGAVYSEVHRILQERGITVLTDCEIHAVRCAVSGFEIDFKGETRVYDQVVSTIPAPDCRLRCWPRYYPHVPACTVPATPCHFRESIR